MTADRDLGRRLADHFADEAPRLAPEWILPSALTTIESTRQRRGLFAPWRFSPMPMYARLGAAATALVAVVAVAFWQLSSTGPAHPASSPSAPASTAPSNAPAPTDYSVPPLNQTFTSGIFGLSFRYPEGWKTTAGVVPWTMNGDTYREPLSDFAEDPLRQDLYLKAASMPLGALSFDQWSALVMAGRGCTGGAPVTIDGVLGRVDSTPACLTAVVEGGGRGYLIAAHWNNDIGELRSIDWGGWFQGVLATVRLDPAKAVDSK